MTEFPSWRVIVYSAPADKWDVRLITDDEDDAREQAGHIRAKGMDARLEHREDKDGEWEEVPFVEGASG